MNKQQIFDTVVNHLTAQGKRSMYRAEKPDWYLEGAEKEHMYCAYRGENGTKCAVGCLISDKDYLPTMEGKSVTTLKTLGMLPHYLSNELNLLADLQIIHDAPGPDAAEMRANLRRVAGRYHLDSSAVDRITEWNP